MAIHFTILVHAPSRSGGIVFSEPFRIHVAAQLCNTIDSIKATEKNAKIIAMGDFNDYADDKSLQNIYEHGMINISRMQKEEMEPKELIAIKENGEAWTK